MSLQSILKLSHFSFLFSPRYNNVIFFSSFNYCISVVVLHLFFDTFIVIAIIVYTIHFRAQYNTIVYYIPNRSTVTLIIVVGLYKGEEKIRKEGEKRTFSLATLLLPFLSLHSKMYNWTKMQLL